MLMTRGATLRSRKMGLRSDGSRRRVGWLTLVVLSLLISVPESRAASTDLSTSLQVAGNAAKQVTGSLGIHIVEMASGETVYEHAAEKLRVIASNTKLFTTAAALDRLGPGFFLETNLLLKGRLAGSALQGNLAIIGGGDPNISGRHYEGDSFAVFRSWAEAIRERGVERIEGDLFLVHGFFEPPRVHPDWPEDQLGRWYEAPVEALSFNDNCVLVKVWPGRSPGAPARVEMVPDLGMFEVRNSAKTTNSSRRHTVILDRLNGSSVLTVAGSVYQHAAPVESWVTVPDPLRYFGVALQHGFRWDTHVKGFTRPLE